MNVAYFILSMMAASLLVLIASVSPARTGLSTYELVRRRDRGSKDAEYELRRETMVADLYSLRRIATGVLLVLLVVLSIGAWSLWAGVLIALIVAVFYGKLATLGPVHAIAMKLYEENEDKLLKWIEKHPKTVGWFRSVVWIERRQALCSREELEHLVKQSQGVLAEKDKRRIINGIHFDQKKVEDIMTPRGVVAYVKKQDVIGPYILNDLHQTGHSRFPVIDGDIDHVVGILHTHDLITLGDKDTKSAGDLMDDHVYYINTNQTLDHALNAFLKSHRHMFIVVNEYRETAGVVTLEDVMEELLGIKILDEFDQHDDLRAVAERVSHRNNNAPHGTNV